MDANDLNLLKVPLVKKSESMPIIHEMTKEEAANIVKHIRHYMEGGELWTDAEFIAMDMAVEALEKQIPQKAIGNHYAHMRCPSCNHRIPSGGGSSSRRRDNWCNYCGQAIDWSKE